MVVGELDITEDKIRARQIEPDQFEEGSFRTIRLAPGIKAIVGKLKGKTSTTVQSILFDKKTFSPEKAKDWLAKHKSKFSDAVLLEEEKVALFTDTYTINEHLIGHLPALTEHQIEKLLTIVGFSEDDEEDDKIVDLNKYLKIV